MARMPLLRSYLISASLIFLLSAVAKISAHYTPRNWALRDPFVTFMTTREITVLASLVELTTAALILFNLGKRPMLGFGLVLWLGLLLLVYRIGWSLAPGTFGTTCKCLGGPGGLLGEHSDYVPRLLLGYILVAAPLLGAAFARPGRILTAVAARSP